MGRMFFLLYERTLNHEQDRGCMQLPEVLLEVIRSLHKGKGDGIMQKTKRTCASKAFVTALHTSRRYFSRYFGKRVAKDDSSFNGPALLSSGLKGSTFHCARKLALKAY